MFAARPRLEAWVVPALIVVLLVIGLGGCGYLLGRHRARSRDPRPAPAADPAHVTAPPHTSPGIVADPPADRLAPPPVAQAWSIADDEEDCIPTALFRPSDDPSFAAFLAEERSADRARPRR